MINIVSSSRYRVDKKRLKPLIGDFLSEKQISSDWIVNIIFVGKTKMKMITQKYKHEKETLPVLSFPYNDTPIDSEKTLGEVFICYPLAILLAAERNKRVEDMLIWLIKHGIENLIK